jgi:hypothetical protein
MTDMKHWIGLWAQGTVEAQKGVQAGRKPGAWTTTYTPHKRGALVQKGDEYFDISTSWGQLVPHTQMVVAKTYIKTGHHYNVDGISDAYYMDAKPGGQPIRLDVVVSPAHLAQLRYINAKGDLTPFSVDQYGLLTPQALRTVVFEITEASADLLRAYLALPRS